MSKSTEILKETVNNLKISNADVIRNRRDEITKKLNSKFRDVDSHSQYRLMVGSWGRHTAIDGISDLDMIYILPPELKSVLHSRHGTQKTLSLAKEAIIERYPETTVRIDRLVVVVDFKDFKFEIQPCFEEQDNSFLYPDTYSDTWKKTDPRKEIYEMCDLDTKTDGNARVLCRLMRAWKRKHEIQMNGLLLDTLVWRYFSGIDSYKNSGFALECMIRDFFDYLSQQPNQDYWCALGSNQKVYSKYPFQRQAKEAADLTRKAIAAEDTIGLSDKWKQIFGRFVKPQNTNNNSAKTTYNDTEEFIENRFDIDIKNDLYIECIVTQDGFRPQNLSRMIRDHILLRPNKKLEFSIITNAQKPYTLLWKVLNRGHEAVKRNMVRGQIFEDSNSKDKHTELTEFAGEHYVECYLIKNNVVVARGHQDVPIRIP